MLKESVSLEKDRLHKYSVFSTAFSYPNDNFFHIFSQLLEERDKINQEYDTLFRRKGIWLYTTEYTEKGGFQKSFSLSDIMGFYKAFGLQIEKERPDSISVELEFMHYLIFKTIRVLENRTSSAMDKASICVDAQRKFFDEHLYPGMQAISERIIHEGEDNFYRDMAEEMLVFLDEENIYFKTNERG